MVFFPIIYKLAKIKDRYGLLVHVHLRIHMTFTAAQLGFVVILTVDALVVLVFFAVTADHYSNGSIHFVIF